MVKKINTKKAHEIKTVKKVIRPEDLQFQQICPSSQINDYPIPWSLIGFSVGVLSFIGGFVLYIYGYSFGSRCSIFGFCLLVVIRGGPWWADILEEYPFLGSHKAKKKNPIKNTVPWYCRKIKWAMALDIFGSTPFKLPFAQFFHGKKKKP